MMFKEAHYVKKMDKLESSSHKNITLSKTLTQKEELRMKRNELKKLHAQAEAEKEINAFDASLDTFLCKRYKMANPIVANLISCSSKSYAASCMFDKLYKDKDLLLRYDESNKYVDNSFVSLLKTTSMGKTLPTVFSRSKTAVNLPSMSLSGTNLQYSQSNATTVCNKQPITKSFTDIRDANRVCESAQPAINARDHEVALPIKQETAHQVSEPKIDFKKKQIDGLFDDLLDISIGPDEGNKAQLDDSSFFDIMGGPTDSFDRATKHYNLDTNLIVQNAELDNHEMYSKQMVDEYAWEIK